MTEIEGPQPFPHGLCRKLTFEVVSFYMRIPTKYFMLYEI